MDIFHHNALLAVSQSTALMLLALAQDNSLTSVGCLLQGAFPLPGQWHFSSYQIWTGNTSSM
mgnify:CR=1 FL=1